VAHAGVVVLATLAGRLGIEALVDERVVLGERVGAGNEGAKVMTLVSAMALGAGLSDEVCGVGITVRHRGGPGREPDVQRDGRAGKDAVLGPQAQAPWAAAEAAGRRCRRAACGVVAR